MYIKKIKVQEWLPYDKVTQDGIIITKNKFVKIIKVVPISYVLKSELEKQAILEAYKLFLRTCNFDIQILIQSKKEDVEGNIKNIKLENNETIDLIKEKYISYIKTLNSNKELSSKNFFILISIPTENSKIEMIDLKSIKSKFTERTLKIEETLSKCGNTILEVMEKREVISIIDSFINPYNGKILKGGKV